MNTFWMGLGSVHLRFRHSRSLKEKRQGIRGAVQKLRNHGFSVCEGGSPDDPKFGELGFSYAGSRASAVEQALEQAKQGLLGEFEVVRIKTDLVEFSGEDEFPDWDESDELKMKFGDDDDDEGEPE